MREITFDGFFDPAATLGCGQTFRFRPYGKGFLVFSKDKACHVFAEGGKTRILCDDADEPYFYEYFNLSRDYAQILSFAKNSGVPAVAEAAEYGKGIHILRQDAEETVFSFILSVLIYCSFYPTYRDIFGHPDFHQITSHRSKICAPDCELEEAHDHKPYAD